MIVGCFALDLYCDNEKCPGDSYAHPDDSNYLQVPDQEIGETRSQCYARARKRGWIISGEKAICPLCSKKKPSNE